MKLLSWLGIMLKKDLGAIWDHFSDSEAKFRENIHWTLEECIYLVTLMYFVSTVY